MVFEGIERWFAVLEGEGVRLTIGNDEARHELRRGSPPLRFDGGAHVSAELIDGPTLDFNLMAKPGAATLRWQDAALVFDAGAVRGRYEPGSGTLHWATR